MVWSLEMEKSSFQFQGEQTLRIWQKRKNPPWAKLSFRCALEGILFSPTQICRGRKSLWRQLYRMAPWIQFRPDIPSGNQISFLAEAIDGGLRRVLEEWRDKLIMHNPEQVGANPYDPFFFRDHFFLEKVNPTTGASWADYSNSLHISV